MIPRKVAERIAHVLDCELDYIFLPEKFTISKTCELVSRSPPEEA